MGAERTVCRTPTPGKKPTSIPTWKFDAIRDAIIEIVPTDPPGLAAKDLPDRVAGRLSAEVREALGSVSWHTTTVKLEMEVAGELQRVPGARPHRLVRT